MKEKALLFLETASDDLGGAKILYKKKRYPQAIFLVYQSVEKICKYVAVRNGLIDAKDVKSKIGHYPIKVFTEFLKNQIIGSAENWRNNMDESSINLNPFYKQFQEEVFQFEATNSVKDISKITELSLAIILNKIESVDTPRIRQSSPLEAVFKNPDSLIKSLIDMGIIEQTQIEALKANDFAYSEFKKEIQIALDKIPGYQKTMAKLVLITSIFSNDLNVTRYPNTDLMKTPSQIFDKDHALVKHLSTITKHIDETIKTLKGLNEYNL